MKVDLTSLLKKEEPSGWTKEDFKRHLRDSLVEIIRLELENLPKDQWEKTLRTWSRICSFAEELSKKGEEERQDLYKRFNFDAVMVHITESLIEKLAIARSIGLLHQGESPQRLISLGLEMAEGSEEISFMKSFFKA